MSVSDSEEIEISFLRAVESDADPLCEFLKPFVDAKQLLLSLIHISEPTRPY